MKVKLGKLKDKAEELATFLEPRVGTKPNVSGDELDIEDEGVRAGVKPRHVKTYIKRFLFMNGLRKNFRVFVAGKELTLQELEMGEEEKKEEEEAKEASKEEEKTEPAPEEEKKEEEAPKEQKPKKAPAKKRATKKKAEPEA